jgi:uncharacterized protein
VAESNVEIVRRGVAAASRGDTADYLAFWDPEVEVFDPTRPDPASPDGVWRGHDAVERWLADWFDSFETTLLEPEEMIESGDNVVVRIHATAQGRGSGIEIENRRWHVYTFRDGTVARLQIYEDRASAMRAAGLEGLI